MQNVIPLEESNFEEVDHNGEKYLQVTAKGRHALFKIFNQLRQQRTVEAARKDSFGTCGGIPRGSFSTSKAPIRVPSTFRWNLGSPR